MGVERSAGSSSSSKAGENNTSAGEPMWLPCSFSGNHRRRVLGPPPPLRVALSLLALAQLAHVAPEVLEGLGAIGRAQQVLAHVLQVPRPHPLVEVALRQEITEQRQRHRRNPDPRDVDELGIDPELRHPSLPPPHPPARPPPLALHFIVDL